MLEQIEDVIEAKARLKMKAAERAVELVEPGMTVGLGSGSIASMWVRLLGERVRDRGLQITAVASSEDTNDWDEAMAFPLSRLISAIGLI
jgi:ribose 5-phosphate isomerase A